MEAMAPGLPLVAAKSGPTCKQIEDERTRLLYDPEKEGDFTKTVCRFEDETLRKPLELNAHKHTAELGWAGAAEQMRDLYEEVIGLDRKRPMKKKKLM